MSRLKQLIKKRKAALGLSSEDLALATGLTGDELRSIEDSDEIGATPVTVVYALAGALDVTAWQLLELIEKAPQVHPTYLAQQIDATYAGFDR